MCENTTKEYHKKIKVWSADIIVRKIDGKPYYEIKYMRLGDNEYRVGYGSYDIDIVFDYLNKYFEHISSETLIDNVSQFNNDLISRKSLIHNLNTFAPEHYSALINDLILKEPIAFDPDTICDKIDNIHSNFDCGICPEWEGGILSCEKSCEGALIKLIKHLVKNGGFIK